MYCQDEPYLYDGWLAATYHQAGYCVYHLDGVKEMKVYYYEFDKRLVIKGSAMYFIQGHNFTYDKHSFNEAIDQMGYLMGIDLWHCDVNEFEAGVIFEVYDTPRDIIKNTRPGKGMVVDENPKDKGKMKKSTCRSYNDKEAYRKLYDAGKNIKSKQGKSMQKIIKECGWNPDSNYMKWEVRYRKPGDKFKGKGKTLKLYDLVNPKYEEAFKNDILAQYKKLNCTKTLERQTNKKHLSAADLIAIGLVELYQTMEDGSTIEEIRKYIYACMNREDALTPNDKKSRRTQLKKIFDRLKVTERSYWDLSDKVEDAINA